MEITSHDQITGSVAKQLRANLKMTQAEFWGVVGVANKSVASSYEREIHRVSEPLQILLYLHHVCRFPINEPHSVMLQLGSAMSSLGTGIAKIKQATAIAEAAIDNLKSAQACMRGK